MSRAGPVELLRCLVGSRVLVRIAGPSMEPMLRDGDRVLVNRSAYQQVLPSVGELVGAYLPAPDRRPMVKLVTRLTPDGQVWLQGTNLAESTDSRHFGAIPAEDVVGRVTTRL